MNWQHIVLPIGVVVTSGQPTCLMSESIEMFLISRSRSVELRPLTPAGLLLLRNPAISPSSMALTANNKDMEQI